MTLSPRAAPRLLLAALALALIPLAAQALSTDKDQPVLVDADNMELDFKSGVRTYIGNVTIRQGSLVIRGDKVIMRYQNGELRTATAYGKPATFKQLPDGASEEVRGKAPKMIYNETKARLYMYRSATLVQGGDILRSKEIEYDINTSRMVARGAPTQKEPGAAGGGRSHITIKPRSQRGTGPAAGDGR